MTIETDEEPARTAPTTGWSTFIGLLALLCGAGAVIGGAVLLLHTDQVCGDYACVKNHPYKVAGIVTMVAGVLQALFIASFAVLHDQVRTLRIMLADLLDSVEQLDGRRVRARGSSRLSG